MENSAEPASAASGTGSVTYQPNVLYNVAHSVPLGNANLPTIDMPRRALRKGTHSCAECKRRKIRCFFETANPSVCVGCRRRGSPCISQEYVDVDVPVPGSSSSESTLVPGATAPATPSGDMTAGLESMRQLLAQIVEGATAGPNADDGIGGARTCNILHAALPVQEDMDVLFQIGRIAIYVQALVNPYGRLFAAETDSTARSIAAMAVLPPASSHPVVLARKLLHVALCIQQLDSSFDTASLPFRLGGRTLQETMHGCFSLATNKVTCHDGLLDSAEGLECLVCEGIYLVNSGNLRRALVVLRRGLTLAQVMGVKRRALWRQHDADTRLDSEATFTHLAYLERFISLHLGIPTAVSGVQFGSRERRPSENAAEWIERLQVDICEYIMQRNHDGTDDYATTRRIDQELKRIVDSLPAAWWVPLDASLLSSGKLTTNELMERIINAQIQIIHYGLMALLHLPFLLRSDNSEDYTYSKAACTFAAREILRRFVSFRSVVKVVFCCRPVDFCGLSSSLILLVSHLACPSGNASNASFSDAWLLPHHRIGDRALITSTIDTMDTLTRLNNNDDMTRESANLARRLLDLENGTVYSATAVEEKGEADDQHTAQPGQPSLLLKIPYFGAIKLTRQADLPRYSESNILQWNSQTLPSRTADLSYLTLSNTGSGKSTLGSSVSVQSSRSHHSHEALDTQDSSHLPSQVTMFPQSQYPTHTLPFHTQSFDYNPLLLATTDEFALQNGADIPMPDFLAGIDDWAFQGVDTTFFTSILGSSSLNLDKNN